METSTVLPRGKTTTDAWWKFENSSERRCKLVFNGRREHRIPTSFVVLPYKLKWNLRQNTLLIPSREKIEEASRIGRYLLEMNKATAKLSFWLQVKRHLMTDRAFKEKLRQWLRRARKEPASAISKEVVNALSCEKEYADVCQELLQEKDKVSNALAYIADPAKAAHKEIEKSIRRLSRLYEGKQNYFYLIDEYRGVPVECDESKGSLYPICIEHDKEYFRRYLVPFMNMTAMTAIAMLGLAGLKQILGLKEKWRRRLRWENAAKGLIHRHDHRFSVAAFAALQKNIRENHLEEMHEDFPTAQTIPIRDSVLSKSWKLRSSSRKEQGQELTFLLTFFEEKDPLRLYSDLQRVSVGSSGPAIWTTGVIVEKLKREANLSGQPLSLGIFKRSKRFARNRDEEESTILTTKLEQLEKICGSSSQLTGLTESTMSNSMDIAVSEDASERCEDLPRSIRQWLSRPRR